MRPIKITSFRDDIALLILNNQEKYNPDKDAYINDSELKELFGKEIKDIKEIKDFLKPNAIFEYEKEGNTDSGNVDSVEISSKANASSEDSKPELTDLLSEDTTNTDSKNNTSNEVYKDAFEQTGSAAMEMFIKEKTDLTLSSAGTPYEEQMSALMKLKNYLDSNNADSTEIEEKIKALKTLVADYLDQHPQMEHERVDKREITYGKDGSKKAELTQYFGLNGTNASSVTDSKVTDGYVSNAEDAEAISEGSTGTNAELAYDIDLKTLNAPEVGNWHVKGTINASTDNYDLGAAILYTRKFKDNIGYMNFAANGRQTIENKNNTTSLGAAFDYNKNKFSTGAYLMYLAKEVNGESKKEKDIEAYCKYKNFLRTSLGTELQDDENYYYTRVELRGKKDIPEKSISLSGKSSLEYGFSNADYAEDKPKCLQIKTAGSISFKGKNFSAIVDGNVTASHAKMTLNGGDKASLTSFVSSLFGKIETKKVDIATTISAIKSTEKKNGEVVNDNRTTITASIEIALKKLFGNGIIPKISYNVGNSNGATQNVNFGVILVP